MRKGDPTGFPYLLDDIHGLDFESNVYLPSETFLPFSHRLATRMGFLHSVSHAAR